MKKYSGYIGFGLLLGGMIIGAIGWDKYDSTIPARTQGSVLLIVTGVAMILGGVATIKLNSSNK